MALFQRSVLQKYLNDLDKAVVAAAYSKFKAHFGSAVIQENIKGAKEEEYQEGFVRDLFVEVLGYTLKPQPNFNLVLEKKNEKDSKKADGAVVKGEAVHAVIELKGTDTVDLDHVEVQAFGYKNNQKGCRYVVVSNFEKLRFYVDDSVEHLEWNLFTLNAEDFAVMYLCLQRDNLLGNLPASIKEASVNEEKDVTKKLYRDYSNFKRQLYQSIMARNPQFDKLTVYKKTQKLLDRFLFILFAEDKQLLPPNSIREILKQWEQLKELDEHVPLYSRYQKYFGYMNTGHKGKLHDIFAYNGGLFAADEVLDNIEVDDQLLYDSTYALSQYDFETEVDVNILGHIFEHSLNDVDAVTAEAEGKQVEKDKTRRKKDGVFYTPKYITKYIVENTVGKLCAEKKAELNIQDEDYSGGKKKKDKKTLNDKLEGYRQWLLQLTILDPACGSGAFLNQALEFLIVEHRKVDELRSKLFEDSMVLSDVENHILENNLFGVDLNEESVEIAKLSLWLRTAKKGRKLSSLNSNIKCGNSLIDDVAVAGDKAFKWEEEFKEVFAKGGFDVVVGNPPYVNVELMPVLEKEYYRTKYDTFFKRGDLFSLFIDIATDRLTEHGFISFIIPSILLNNLSYKLIRERLLKNNWLVEVCYTGNKVFQDATVDTVVLIIDKSKTTDEIKLVNALEFYNPKMVSVPIDFFEKYDNNISIGSGDSNTITDKIYSATNIEAQDYFQIFQGVVTGNNDVFVFETLAEGLSKGIEKTLLHPMCHGRDISKWKVENEHTMLYVNEDIEINDYPGALAWLTQYKEQLSSSKSSEERSSKWYGLHRPRVKNELLTNPKILIQNTRNERLKPRIVATIDEEGLLGTQGLNFIIPSSDISIYDFLGLLNSKVIDYLFSTKLLNLAIKADYLKKIKFPVKLKTSDIGIQAKKMGELNRALYTMQSQFLTLLQSKFDIGKVSGKLEKWYELDFKEFLKELGKVKVKMSLGEEAEWLVYFGEQKQKAVALKQEIDRTDKEIDRMVYDLYELTEEEVRIVEGR